MWRNCVFSFTKGIVPFRFETGKPVGRPGLSDVDDYPGSPTFIDLPHFELVKGNRFVIHDEAMPLRINELAGKFSISNPVNAVRLQPNGPSSQQELFGIFVINQLLPQLKQQHVNLSVGYLKMPVIPVPDRGEVADPNVYCRIACRDKHLLDAVPPGFERRVCDGNVFQISIRHIFQVAGCKLKMGASFMPH
jgi:hypothetical protein